MLRYVISYMKLFIMIFMNFDKLRRTDLFLQVISSIYLMIFENSTFRVILSVDFQRMDKLANNEICHPGRF